MEAEQSKYSRHDLVWLIALALIGGGLSTEIATTIFDFSVFISGILCVGLIAIGRREGYLIGLYNSLSYSILAYGNGLYGEMYLSLLFFIPTGIVGYFMWLPHTSPSRTVAMRQLIFAQRLYIATACIVCTVGLGLLLALNPGQNTPFIDATTNVLSVMATFLMMWRYKEQWLLYILLNIVTIVMWVLRLMAGGPASDLMVLMWSLFLINAMYGYWRWHVGAKRTVMAASVKDDGESACDLV